MTSTCQRSYPRLPKGMDLDTHLFAIAAIAAIAANDENPSTNSL
jgi:hypothetical protein